MLHTVIVDCTSPSVTKCGEGLGDWRPASLELLVLGVLAPHHMVCPQVRFNSARLFTFENYVAADNSRMHIAKCHQVYPSIANRNQALLSIESAFLNLKCEISIG